MVFDLLLHYYMEFLKETAHIYLTSKDKYLTLTLPVYELSDHDRSKKVFLTCNSFTMWCI